MCDVSETVTRIQTAVHTTVPKQVSGSRTHLLDVGFAGHRLLSMSIMLRVEHVYREVPKVVECARMSEGFWIDVKWGPGSHVGLLRCKCIPRDKAGGI